MLDICWKGGYKGNSLQNNGLKVKKGVVSERKDDRIKAIRNLEKILAEPTDGPDDYMSCDYCDN